eukprot:4213178-Alexandrium_andersonii.AAC.1
MCIRDSVTPRARGTARKSRPVPSLGGLVRAAPSPTAPTRPPLCRPTPSPPSGRPARRRRRRA